MNFRSLVFLLLTALLAAGIAAPSPAQESATQSKFDYWIDTLADIEQEIATGTIDDAEIARLERRVRAVQTEARALRAVAEKELGPLQNEQRALGIEEAILPADETDTTAAPSPQPPEVSAGVVDRRAQLQQQIADVQGIIQQADLIQARTQTLLHRLGQLSSQRIFERVLSREAVILDGAAWTAARTELVRLVRSIGDHFRIWVDESSPVAVGWTPWLLALAAAIATFATAIAARRSLCRHHGYDPSIESPGYGRIVLAAAVEAITRSMAPALALIVGGGVLYAYGLGTQDKVPVLYSISMGILFYLIVSNIVRAVFSPEAPQWRLAQLAADKAQRLGRHLHFLTACLAVVVAVNILIESLGRFEQGFANLRDLAFNTGFAFLLFLLLDRRLWQGVPADADKPAPSGGAAPESDADQLPAISPVAQIVRLLLGVVILAIPVSALVGYYGLSNHISQVILLGAVTIGFAYLLRATVHELLRWFLAPGTYAVGSAGRFLGLRRQGSERLLLLMCVTFDIVIALSTLHLLLLIVGVPQTIISIFVNDFWNGITIGEFTFSPGDIIIGVGLFVLGVLLTRYLTELVRIKLLPMTRLDAGVQNSITMAANYAGIILATVIGISALGIDLSNLAIIAGALSVGIGFGLREVVNNFVSGLLLLIERPVKVGDWIVVGQHEGTVKRIAVRSTEIETFDRAEVIVPNSELITGSVVNWTHRSQTIRISLSVGVAYGTDPRQVHDILKKLPEEFDEVLTYPAPQVLFRDFGDSSLDFQLRFYLRNADGFFSVPSRMRFRLVELFDEAGISIPFPQRDIHIIPPGRTSAEPDTAEPEAAPDSGDTDTATDPRPA
jgi:small-conductance mechanosensitive channel